MPHSGVLSPADQERAELEAVSEWLIRSPRLVKLLQYVGERYFRGESDQLKEYNIATEVFGRSATSFNSTDDAIARVEAHRLRKRLKEFYETEGKDHAVRISIPLGTYVPVFTHVAVAPEAQLSTEQAYGTEELTEMEDLPPETEAYPPRQARRTWVYMAISAGLIVACIAGLRTIHQIRRSTAPATGAAATPNPLKLNSAHRLASSAVAPIPLRLMAGYNGPPHLDSSGNVWGADRYFQGGRSWARNATFTGRTSRPFLFQQWRSGEFAYDIPLNPGVYELHLFFVDSGFGPGGQGSDSDNTFTVFINGQLTLSGFNIEEDAMGPNIADERVFKDVVPASDGMLHIAFQGEKGLPILNAVEILPGTPHKQIPIRLTSQTTSFVDHAGHFWEPDNYSLDGEAALQTRTVSGTPDPQLFGLERFGHFTYAIPVDPHGQYTVTLHFAEFYFGPQASGAGGVGSRVFNVMCNGVLLLDHFDIFKEVGSLHLLTKTFYHLKPTAQGKLNLTFEPVANNATISGIEVFDESQ
jgi:hypothetical protein